MIDHNTVERIKSAANIVEVVSEFVTLRRAGANYKGLCPFHNEKTPSFIVSPSRGTCHCFGCGRGGNAVSFIMEHEQYTYPEALRWLAQKYHIEVEEKELTAEERAAQSAREATLIVTAWASEYFEHQLKNTADGAAIGMPYYRSRGFRDDIIARYHLGYDSSDRLALAIQAQKEGYKEEFLIAGGLCYKNDRGALVDRFAGRVVFPWYTVSGKVVGFSARLLDSRTKGVAQKYVNSPDSDIYHKDREMYGLYQAKKSIAQDDRVLIVEGQTDVLALAQSGIDNVVATSGTALSGQHVSLLHRFTDNVTLLFDGDDAGEHATTRGTDLLLADGMHVRILVLPTGEDPDSYARNYGAAALREYVANNQQDVIQYRTQHILHSNLDPQQRTERLDDIVRSIALVPNQVLRDTYLHDVAAAVGMKEATLLARMNTFIRERKEGATPSSAGATTVLTPSSGREGPAIEQMLAQLIVRHGTEIAVPDVVDDSGNHRAFTVAQYVLHALSDEALTLSVPLYQTLLTVVAQVPAGSEISAAQFLINHDDIAISSVAAQLATDKYSPLPTENAASSSEEGQRQQVLALADHLLLDFRRQEVERQLQEIKGRLAQSTLADEERQQAMTEYQALLKRRNALAQRVRINVL